MDAVNEREGCKEERRNTEIRGHMQRVKDADREEEVLGEIKNCWKEGRGHCEGERRIIRGKKTC